MKNKLPTVHIENDMAFTKVFINGEQVEGVQFVEFKQSVEDDFPTLRLHLLCDRVTIDGGFIPQLPKAYRGFYEERR